MIYKIIAHKDEFLEKIFKESMDDLNVFYEINWVHHLPKIVVIDNREMIDSLRREKSEPWIVGWAEGGTVYVLNKDNLEKESNHKYTPESYAALVRHELSHLFFRILSGQMNGPIWLNEGFAIYTSGQNKLKQKVTNFSQFLGFYDHSGSGVYHEAGFFVEALIEKYGKQKLFNLVKELRNLKKKEEFEQFFAREYGFQLTYEEINAQKLI